MNHAKTLSLIALFALAAFLLLLPRPTKASPLVFQPHYDFNTVGQYWALSVTAEDQTIPRVILLAQDSSGFYYPDANGVYLTFVGPDDAVRLVSLPGGALTNLSRRMRDLDPIAAAINENLRASNYYLNRVTTTAEVHFSPTDIVINRTVWSPSLTASGTYFTYNEAVKRFYYYEETGGEATGPDTRIIVPLRHISADPSVNWVSPSDGGTKTGLCYYILVSKKIYFRDCYKPTFYNDPAATRFMLYNNETAEEMVLKKTTLENWRSARAAAGDYINGSAAIYCQNTTREVWGDGPYANWIFDSSFRPMTDSLALAQPIYGATTSGAACQPTSTGAFFYAMTPPADNQIVSGLLAALPRALEVDVIPSSTIDEFRTATAAYPRLATLLKSIIVLNHFYWCDVFVRIGPGYVCPPLPSWPAVMTVTSPWYGGYFDHLYYDGLDLPCYNDADDDGMGDCFETAYFCAGLDPAVPGNAQSDPDADGRTNLTEFLQNTNPCVPEDSDGDGLTDDLEITLGTNLYFWDTDGDGISDRFEADNMSNHDPGQLLDPLLITDGAADFDGDGIENAHEFWNGTSLWATNPAGYAACGYWGESDGDGWVTGNDRDMLLSASIGNPTDYSGVFPPTGETQDLDRDGWYTGNDVDLLNSMMVGADTPFMQSRPAALEAVDTCAPTLSIGDTCHVSVSVLNSLTPTAGHQAAIPVVFTVDPSSTGSATILGGEGTGDLGGRYDLSSSALSSPAGVSRAVVRADGPGTVRITARVPQCGTEMGVGRSSAEIVLPTFATVTVP